MKSAIVLGAYLLAVAEAAVVKVGTRSPVEKVVTLLKDLQSKVQEDGKVEQQVYDKYACWCEKTSAKKGEAIETAQKELRALGQSILKLKGKVAVLTAEIEEHSKSIAANEEEQAQATSIRQKENEAYSAEVAEMKQAIAALQKAVEVIVAGAAPGAAFLQQQASSSAVRVLLQSLPSDSRGMKPDHLALLAKFSREDSKSQLNYAPQSLTVQGILKDMYETFTADLESSTNAEATSNKHFESFIATKMDELNQLKETKEAKEAEKAEAEALLADTTQSYDDTDAQMKADIDFFDATKSSCEAKSAEWSTRSALRAEELEGIDKALEILTSDSARELFSKAINPGKETGMDSASLLQIGKVSAMRSAPTQAYMTMRIQARRAHSLRLAALAVRVRQAKVGHFDEVLKAIDDMMSALKEEDAADIAKRDQCKEEYKNTEGTIANITWLIEKNEAKIDKLASLIELRTADKEATIVSINETEIQIEDMKFQREEDHQAFLHAKADDEDAVSLLSQAKAVLMSYYTNNSVELGPIQAGVKDLALAQEEPIFEVSADQAPEAKFSGKGKRKDESKGIVSIMTYLIQDLNDEITNGVRDEETAQSEFEKQLKAAETLKSDLIDKKTNLETTIGRLGEEKADENSDMEENQVDLKDETEYKEKITPDCDWIIGAFEKRAGKRAAEMSGLAGAKDLLAGMTDKAALLQKKGRLPSTEPELRKIKFLGLHS